MSSGYAPVPQMFAAMVYPSLLPSDFAELFDSDFAELSPPAAAPLLSDDAFPHPATIAATIAPTSNKLIAFFFMFAFPFFLFNDFSLSFNSCCS